MNTVALRALIVPLVKEAVLKYIHDNGGEENMKKALEGRLDLTVDVASDFMRDVLEGLQRGTIAGSTAEEFADAYSNDVVEAVVALLETAVSDPK